MWGLKNLEGAKHRGIHVSPAIHSEPNHRGVDSWSRNKSSRSSRNVNQIRVFLSRQGPPALSQQSVLLRQFHLLFRLDELLGHVRNAQSKSDVASLDELFCHSWSDFFLERSLRLLFLWWFDGSLRNVCFPVEVQMLDALFGFLGEEQFIDENAWEVDFIGMDSAGLHDFFHLGNGHLCSLREVGVGIACSLAKD